jgi:hypothetical protein
MTGPVTFYKYLGVLPFDAKNHPQRHRVKLQKCHLFSGPTLSTDDS